MWPGRIANSSELKGPRDKPNDPTRWIKWFGDHKFTEVCVCESSEYTICIKLVPLHLKVFIPESRLEQR